MNERLDEFESELSRLRPRDLSPGLTDGIATQLDMPARPSWSDRCLMAFMTGGALAASLIVGLMGWSALVDRTPVSVSNAPAVAVVTYGGSGMRA